MKATTKKRAAPRKKKDTVKKASTTKSKKKRNEPEFELQSACVAWFNQHRPEWILMSIPMEAIYSRKEKFKKSGALSGSPDLVIVRDGETFFIEMKSQTGRCSKEQKELHKKIISLDNRVYVVRTIEAFIALCS